MSTNFVATFNSNVRGRVIFTQSTGSVFVTINLTGLKPNQRHGIHVHEKRLGPEDRGDDQDCCAKLGGHFNPHRQPHGSYLNVHPWRRHVGDLCNNILSSEDGMVLYDYKDDMVSLDPEETEYIGDRSIVIHAHEDDLGRGGFNGLFYTQMPAAVIKWFGRDATNPEALISSSQKDGNAGKRIACANLYPE